MNINEVELHFKGKIKIDFKLIMRVFFSSGLILRQKGKRKLDSEFTSWPSLLILKKLMSLQLKEKKDSEKKGKESKSTWKGQEMW